MDIKDIVRIVKERQLVLAVEAMEHPAKTYEDYMHRVGRYAELTRTLDELISKDAGPEEDND